MIRSAIFKPAKPVTIWNVITVKIYLQWLKKYESKLND